MHFPNGNDWTWVLNQDRCMDSPALEPDDICINRWIPMEATDGKNLTFMVKLVCGDMGEERKSRCLDFETVLTSLTRYHVVP